MRLNPSSNESVARCPEAVNDAGMCYCIVGHTSSIRCHRISPCGFRAVKHTYIIDKIEM